MLWPMFEIQRPNIVVKSIVANTLILLLSILPITAISEEVKEKAKIGGEFELTSQFNQPYSSTSAHGKVVMLFFGFTHCPEYA